MHTEIPRYDADVVVIGGSYAGLSAALQLARARRRVLVVDAGVRRNRFAAHSHGFLGQDGRAPGDIAAAGRAEVLAYPTVRWHDGAATGAQADGDGFAVSLADGATVRARRLVLAVGVEDQLPPIDGLASRWGRSVFHCPYCHGYELGGGRIGVLATSALSHHHAMMLPDWGTVTLFTNGCYAPDAAQREALAARGVAIEPARVECLVDMATLALADGRRVVLDGLFTLSRTQVNGSVAAQLGCAMDEGPMGAYLRTDAIKETSVPGVFACGDAARAAGSIAFAVGDGVQAGVGAHQSLLSR
ncbi:NAD(P)/FAD-dependent oxidoreductase [Dokdonella koreensis]|uniref:Thioredoxin reductase n=1 Tax=Dokdonella koreensis DS-123 TaxID=1300342 RepID=A0A160DYL1_9GAMM|nr:NAD(P)/FAD-dependent oxidoreductase [Dokdonella koreensis]ANB19501.1 Thioredoxin reductase [Dokdonella koreensis DS-123]